MTEIEKEINLLIKKINQWNKEYFDNDSSSVSDRVYDTNLRKLSNLEKQYPNLLKDDSPTKKIGSNLINKFNKVLHKKQMLSLDKAYSKIDVEKFINDVSKVINDDNQDFYIEPKIDGLSISLQYKNGKLIKAITRGDGSTGEDVTDNVFNIISDIPTLINYKNDIEIRGEVFITKSNFNKINDNSKFSNPRNMASGTLRQISNKIVLERKLSCLVYEIISPETHSINRYNECVLFLKNLGFKTIEEFSLEKNNIDSVMKYIHKFEKMRDELDFETDGIVIKLNNVSYYDKLGFTSKFPKYNIAYKFDDESVETKLKGINITIGRTGMVTYNAELEPVLLKGSIISAATLHNFNYIHKLNINIGDDIMLKKAGEIIPKVFSLSKKNNHNIFKKILICPFCNSNLIDNELNTDQFCINDSCSEKIKRKLIHFASRKGMNINGLGESWIRIFYDSKIIKRYPDIYLLNNEIDKIKLLDRIGDKSLNNLLNSIEKSKSNSLDSVFFSLSIDHLGERNCKLIASKIKSLENFISYNLEELNEIKDIGPITLKSLKEFQLNKENIDDIKNIISLGVNPKYKEIVINNENFFTNKLFVITGTFNIKRNEIQKIVENNGGVVSSSISSKTNYLLCGNNPGSKKTKAEELGIEIISEDNLIEFSKHI